ncbi:hypothetical protein [Calidifontibacter terrae]
MKWLGREPKVPESVVRVLKPARGEKVLAYAVDDNTGATVVATSADVALLHNDQVVWQRPWMDVDSGQWNPDTWTLSITWTDRSRAAQFSFKDTDTRLPEVFHERVQASVVLSAPLPLTGPGSTGRVVIRKDLRSGRLHEQRVLGRRTDPSDPQVAQAISRVSAQLRDQVGL